MAPSNLLEILKKENQSVAISSDDDNKASSIYVYDDPPSASLKYLLNFKLKFSMQEQVIKAIFDNYFDESEVVEKLYMSETEIVELSTKGFLGSHTHNHYPLGLLSAQEIEFELKNSKVYFEKLTNTPINMVSYPYGTMNSCTTQVSQIAKKLGYKYGFTTIKGINTKDINKLLLNRYDCNDLIGGKNSIEL